MRSDRLPQRGARRDGEGRQLAPAIDGLSVDALGVKQEFRVTGEVPRLGDIGMLRACLAYEEHRWCAWGDDDSVMTSDDVRYLAALLEAIRSRLH